jgi:hypothetical protein
MGAPTVPYLRPDGKTQSMPHVAQRERGEGCFPQDAFKVGQVWAHFVFRILETEIVGLTEWDVYHKGDDGVMRVDTRMSFRNGFPDLVEEP